MALNNSSYMYMLICWICVFLVEVCDARFRARFRFRYTSYSSYGYYGSSSGLSDGAIAGIVSGSVVFCIILICIIVCCCSKKKEANKGVVLHYNPNQQKINTSNCKAGVTYPSNPSTRTATPGVNSPSQPYPYGTQYNTAFQYGTEDPDRKYDKAPPPYNASNGQNNVTTLSPYHTQGTVSVSNIKVPPP
ncbi:uncharacterized protein LOC133171858 [Saccostrea echinata]|uniref:uncharacterized protein LOC133171858 n=1 Tax=Saccostrea echinata TaxID=191078 RepID=UPI002A7EA83B|nr:uncharacterized protein LOC133171858 [Saccostrea echinata]